MIKKLRKLHIIGLLVALLSFSACATQPISNKSIKYGQGAFVPTTPQLDTMVPIPNYQGYGPHSEPAGQMMLDDINAHFNGTSGISPAFATLVVTQSRAIPSASIDTVICNGTGVINLTLPQAVGTAGKQYKFKNVTSNACNIVPFGTDTIDNTYTTLSPLVLSSLNASQIIQESGIGKWSIVGGGSSSGNGFPLISNGNANTFRITGLATNTTTGDALSQGQSTLNSLLPPVSSFSMNGQALNNVSPGSVANQPLTFGQVGGQLSANTYPVGTSVGSPNFNLGGPSVTVTPPAGIADGNVLIALLDGSNGNTFTYPSGFTQIRIDNNGAQQTGIACKVAHSESGNYVFSSGSGGQGFAAVILLPQLTSCTVDTSTAVVTSGTNSVSVSPVTTSYNNDLVLNVLSPGNGCMSINSFGGTPLWGNCSTYGLMASTFINSSTTIPTTTDSIQQGATANNIMQLVAFKSPSIVSGQVIVAGQQNAQLGSLNNTSIANTIDISAPPYNAKDDGSTDDYLAIQTAVDDACGYPTPPTGTPTGNAFKPVFVPPAAVCYMHSQPIRLPCSELEFFGRRETSSLCQNYSGPAVIQSGWGYGSLPTTSLPPGISGTGNGLTYPNGGQVVKFIDVARFNNGAGSIQNFSQLLTSINQGLNISFFWEPTNGSSGGEIASSKPSYPGSGTGAFEFTGSPLAVSLKINTAGGSHTFSSCSSQTINTTNEYEVDWDKTTYRFFKGVPGSTSVLCDSWSSSSPMVMSPYEEILFPDGGETQGWPDNSSAIDNPQQGVIASFKIEMQSQHTSTYTTPSVTSSVDGYTDYLTNFETTPDGSEVGYTGMGGISAVYLPVINGYSIGGAGGQYMHDLNLCHRSANQGSINQDGLYSMGANDAHWTNLDCPNASYVGFDFAGNDYFATANNVNSYGGHVGFNLGPAWNHSHTIDMGVDGTDQACYTQFGGGFDTDEHSQCVDRGSLKYGVIAQQTAMVINNWALDQELSNLSYITSFLFQDAWGIFTGGTITNQNSGPYITHDGSSQGDILIGTSLAGSAGEVFSFSGAMNSPSQLIGVTLPTGTALSNQTNDPWVQVVNNGTVTHPVLPLGTETSNFNVSWATQDTISATLGASSLAITLKTPNENSIDYLVLCQDSSGSRTGTTFAAGTGITNLKWAGGSAPPLTTTLNKCDRLKFAFDGTNLVGSADMMNY